MLRTLTPDALPESRNRGIFLTDQRVEVLKQRIANEEDPAFPAFLNLRQQSFSSFDCKPQAPGRLEIPYAEENQAGHAQSIRAIQWDANLAYTHALCYRLTGKDESARAAVRILHAWASRVESFSTTRPTKLAVSTHFPTMIFAADLLRWSPHQSRSFQLNLTRFIQSRALPLHTMAETGSGGAWGLLHFLTCATYLHDGEMIRLAVQRWKDCIENLFLPDGHLAEVQNENTDRGIWLSHFHLMPLTLCAEIARVNGNDLFSYISPGGCSLRNAFHCVARYTLDPLQFPYYNGPLPQETLGYGYASYFEILHSRWPNPEAHAVLKFRRPMSALHGAPHLTLTHGNLPSETYTKRKTTPLS